MIQLASTPDRPLVATMWAPSPRVYLDHCIVQTIARDSSLSAEVRAAFEASGGTLLVSWASLLELLVLGEGSKKAAIDEWLESIGASFCFLEVDPRAVITRELAPPIDGVSPFVDDALLGLLLEEWDGRHPPTLLYVSQLTRRYPTVRAQLAQMQESFKANVTASIDGARRRYRGSDRDRQSCHEYALPVRDESDTAAVYRAVLSECVRTNDQFEDGDALDFLHAVVAGANADLVGLDKKWSRRMNQLACSRMRATVVGVGEIEAIVQFLRGWS